jgi:hypothetical protein
MRTRLDRSWLPLASKLFDYNKFEFERKQHFKFLESVSSLLLDRFGHWKRGNNLERISDWHKIHPSYNELSNRRRRSINTAGHLSFDYDSLYSWTDAVCRLFSHSTELNLFSLPEAIAKGD